MLKAQVVFQTVSVSFRCWFNRHVSVKAVKPQALQRSKLFRYQSKGHSEQWHEGDGGFLQRCTEGWNWQWIDIWAYFSWLETNAFFVVTGTINNLEPSIFLVWSIPVNHCCQSNLVVSNTCHVVLSSRRPIELRTRLVSLSLFLIVLFFFNCEL